jgi:hypothetical protein
MYQGWDGLLECGGPLKRLKAAGSRTVENKGNKMELLLVPWVTRHSGWSNEVAFGGSL